MCLTIQQPDVLVADDDPTAIASVQFTLSEAGHSVATACSGSDTIRAAIATRPRLVILDVGMPDVGGYDVCRLLRANPATAEIPILFLSSASALASRVAGFRAGGVDFLAKPFEPAELLARVEAHL